MEKETDYLAPRTEIMDVQVEKGFVGTNELPNTGEEEVW